MIRVAVIVVFLSLTGWSPAQSVIEETGIDISKIKDASAIIDKCTLFIDSNGAVQPGAVFSDFRKPGENIDTKKNLPLAWITKPICLNFTLENRDDTLIKVYFIAGLHARNMRVFKVSPDRTLVQVKDQSRKDGYQPIELKGGEKQEYIAKFNFIKKNLHYIQPHLIKDDYLGKYKNLNYFKNDAQPAIGYLLSGILLMMIFFTGANYLQSKKKEFLYNCCYSLCMFGLIFLNTFLERKSGAFSSLFNDYLDFMLLATGTVFYIAFTRKFLETKLYYPLLNRIFINEEKLVIGILALFTFLVFFAKDVQMQKTVENGMKVIALIIGIIYIVIALAQKNKLMNYLAVGNAILIVFSIVSFCMILFQKSNTSIFTNSMIYYEIGVVSELIFFLLGLTYKNRIELIEKIKEQEAFKLEAEKISYETKLAVLNAQQEERNRISADMHDDLGAGVTAIRLYSELAKKRIGKEVIPEIEKISSSANELLNNMNAIIWTMSSSNDSLDNMVAYIRSYAIEYFENTGINCEVQIEENLPNISVSGEIRRNIYLVIKEALSNILKHSRATEVSIALKRDSEGLSLYIQDNGTGIDFDNLRRFGNGLINMKKRMEKTQIAFTIENKNGTLIKLHRKLEF